MIFEENKLYHIYNQGNNKQKIFFSAENYLFFLKKIKLLILPHADILAWCLMPNHFHLMVYVHTLEISDNDRIETCVITRKVRNLNDSIGLILRTYTRAINKQEKPNGFTVQNRTQKPRVLLKSKELRFHFIILPMEQSLHSHSL